MRTDHSILIRLHKSVLVCLLLLLANSERVHAQSQSAKIGQPIKQTFRMIVPASFSTVGPAPVVFANRESVKQPLQFKSQQWTIHSQSRRGLNVTVSLKQPSAIQRLDYPEGSLDVQLPQTLFKATLQTINKSSFLRGSLQSSTQSTDQLDHENLKWQTGTDGTGRLTISVAPSMVVVDGLSEHDSPIHSPRGSLAIITSEVTESP